MLYDLIIFGIGFIVGALVFRNNAEKGEAYAKLLDAKTASIAQKLINWFSNLGKKTG